MKHLKTFEDMINESAMFSKTEVIEHILIEMHAKMYGEEEFRDDLKKLSPNEFEELANQYGYKEFREGYWVPDYSKSKTDYGKKKINHGRKDVEYRRMRDE